jgi:hypothetical protein
MAKLFGLSFVALTVLWSPIWLLPSAKAQSSRTVDEPLKEDGLEPAESTTTPTEPVIWKNGECVTSQGPARVKGLVGPCGDVGALRTEKGSALAPRFENARLMGLRTLFASLTRVSFDESDLEAAEFREAVITRSSFRRAQCPRCNFSGAVVKSSNLSHANLTSASFRGGRLHNSDFRESNLQNADLRSANLSYCDFRKANLKGARLSETVLLGSQWTGALFDSKTELPFSRETAQQKGMIFSP